MAIAFEESAGAIDLDRLLEGPEFYFNPYIAFNRLRRESPVHWHASGQAWLVSRHDDADTVIRSPTTFSSYGFQNAYFESLREDIRRAAPTMEIRGRERTLITSDPPPHTRLRRLLQLCFTPRVVAALREQVVMIVDELLSARVRPDALEVVSELAYPLPAIMIAEIMGVPRQDREIFKRASSAVVSFMNRADPNGELTLEFAASADRTLASLREYLTDLAALRKAEPLDDVVSALVHADFDGEVLTREEILANLTLFLIAGHETTTNLIGNAVYLLLTHRDQYAMLHSDPSLVPRAIEEVLRFESPVQRLRRIAAVDVELGGSHILAGDPIEVLVGSANRDETRHANGAVFDIRRQSAPNLAFGKSIHFCLGAALATPRGDGRLDEPHSTPCNDPPRQDVASGLVDINESARTTFAAGRAVSQLRQRQVSLRWAAGGIHPCCLPAT